MYGGLQKKEEAHKKALKQKETAEWFKQRAASYVNAKEVLPLTAHIVPSPCFAGAVPSMAVVVKTVVT